MFNSISHLLRQLADGTGKDVVLAMRQPLTANQMARKLGVRPTQASALIDHKLNNAIWVGGGFFCDSFYPWKHARFERTQSIFVRYQVIDK